MSNGLRGHLDSYTSSGYFEGWALDGSRPLRALPVAVLKDNKEIASGLAHRFRRDLMESYCGTGWCAFRLRVRLDAAEIPDTPLSLVDRSSGLELHLNPAVACMPDLEPLADTVDSICADDPTLIDGVWQLRACEKLMMSCIRKHGVDHFVRLGYIYVLGRPADTGGLAMYSRSIRHGNLTPVGVLEALADSEEYRSQSRQLIAPNAVGFLFVA